MYKVPFGVPAARRWWLLMLNDWEYPGSNLQPIAIMNRCTVPVNKIRNNLTGSFGS